MSKRQQKNETRSDQLYLEKGFVFLAIFLTLGVFSFSFSVSAVPEGFSNINVTQNDTKTTTGATILNTSGGYITTINLTARVQNVRWKAFVGYVNGRFTLDDASGSTLYDWSITTIAGEIYASRNASTVAWTQIKCANTTLLEAENTIMSHTNPSDNITRTFSGSTHAEFFVGAVNISVNSCPTLNTYQNNASQDTNFEEIALFDGINATSGGNIVFSTIIDANTTGFDSLAYDFQMIVPENGASSFTGRTAYYLYVELS